MILNVLDTEARRLLTTHTSVIPRAGEILILNQGSFKILSVSWVLTDERHEATLIVERAP